MPEIKGLFNISKVPTELIEAFVVLRSVGTMKWGPWERFEQHDMMG